MLFRYGGIYPVIYEKHSLYDKRISEKLVDLGLVKITKANTVNNLLRSELTDKGKLYCKLENL